MEKYRRWGKALIERVLKYRRIVVVAGPRQCGKSTLVKEFADGEVLYWTFDDVEALNAVLADIKGFVYKPYRMIIIDEVQRIPSILSLIKMRVDEDTRPGQFLLTGSANIQSLPGVRESLAGRVNKIRLRTLSQGEIRGRSPDFLKRAFSQSFDDKWDEYSRDDILRIAFRGGFPEVIELDDRERSLWHRNYVEALIERDLKDIINIRRKDVMEQLFVILAAWSGKFMDVSSIGSGLSVQRSTIESYINALEALFVFERLRPWVNTDYGRVGKHSKIFVTDSGLMASMLGWRFDEIQFDSDRIGKLIETFIFKELSIQVDLDSDLYALYHYRDRQKREIDFIIEGPGGMILGIEVKAGFMIEQASFKHLRWFRDNLAKEKRFIGIVLYTGERALSFGEGMWAVPIGALWG